MGNGVPGEIRQRPEREEHQPDEEHKRKGQDSVNHFTLGDQMHEIPGYQKCFAASDKKSNADVEHMVAERDVGSAYCNERAEQ